MSGKSAEPATLSSSNTRKMARLDWSCGEIRLTKFAPTTTVRFPQNDIIRAHLLIVSSSVIPDMRLAPNVGSDRSWVWNTSADVSEGEAEAQTLAIRFANPESKKSLYSNRLLKRRQPTYVIFRRQSLQGLIYQGPAGERSSHREGVK